MARIRTVKPELWTDPEFVECSLSARLLLIAMLNFASDYGVLADKPKQIKMQCLPADSVDVEELIEELIEQRFLLRDVHPNGDKVLIIRTFSQHQRVDKINPGRWGDPADWSKTPELFPEHSKKGSGKVAEGSRTEGKGREGKGENSRATKPEPPPRSKSKDELPEDFMRFYTAYPKHQGREPALRRWRKMTKTDRALATEAVPAYAREREGQDPQYTPLPARWLNEKRWEDVGATKPRHAAVEVNGVLMDPRAVS